MTDPKIDSFLVGLTEEAVKEGLKEQYTLDNFLYETKLLDECCHRMDITNLGIGQYTETALAKLKRCQEILDKNLEKISLAKVMRWKKKLVRIEKKINKKILYGQKINKYIDKLEQNALTQVKADFIDDDQKRYNKIRDRLHAHKEEILAEVARLKVILPYKPEVVEEKPKNDGPKLV